MKFLRRVINLDGRQHQLELRECLKLSRKSYQGHLNCYCVFFLRGRTLTFMVGYLGSFFLFKFLLCYSGSPHILICNNLFKFKVHGKGKIFQRLAL